MARLMSARGNGWAPDMREGGWLRGGSVVVLGAALVSACIGCGDGNSTAVAPEAKVHATHNFSASELNAPLSSQAKTSGAQVPPPPTR